MTDVVNNERGPGSAPLLEVKGLKKYFPIRKGFLQKIVGQVKAVDDVSFVVHHGETLSLVGESGCGKTTLARTLLGLTALASTKTVDAMGHAPVAGCPRRYPGEHPAIRRGVPGIVNHITPAPARAAGMPSRDGGSG